MLHGFYILYQGFPTRNNAEKSEQLRPAGIKCRISLFLTRSLRPAILNMGHIVYVVCMYLCVYSFHFLSISFLNLFNYIFFCLLIYLFILVCIYMYSPMRHPNNKEFCALDGHCSQWLTMEVLAV